MRQFANELLHSSEALKKEELRMFGDLGNLGATWKDERFQHFDRLITESARELAAFHTSASRYAEYLKAKARAAEKFLRP
jgi:hypothetical protein